jgi:uncharacterized protein (DUF4415 family)
MKKSKRALGSDLAKLDATTDEDIARQIAEDPDAAPELTEELLEEAELFEGDRFIRRVGRPRGSGKKELVTIRLDRDVLQHFRAGGPGWQTRLNDALRAATPTSAEKVRAELKEVHFAPRPPALREREIGSSGQARPGVSRGPTFARPATAREGHQPRRARSPTTS